MPRRPVRISSSWLSGEIAGRVLERADGDLKEAANTLNLPIADLRKLLSHKK